MTIKINISGVQKLLGRLRNEAIAAEIANKEVVTTGYTASYAVYVHEAPMTLKGQKRPKPRKGLYWDPQGRATNKFLEKAARENITQVNSIINTVMSKTSNKNMSGRMINAMILGALLIQRRGQKLVPVDTGNLKASAFTRKGV